MHESIAHIAEQLKQARAAKGLSQRALSAKAGIPQSHISKIESGAVNLQLSSLIELSRVLGLELMLVPQKAAPAAKSVVISAAGQSQRATDRLFTEQRTLQKQLDKFSKGFQFDNATMKEFEKISKQLQLDNEYIKKFESIINPPHLGKLNETIKKFEAITNPPHVQKFNKMMKKIENTTQMSGMKNLTGPRRKYMLDNEDED